MKKILTFLLALTIWSATQAGTRYSPTANISDSCQTQGERGGGFTRNNQKMVMYTNTSLGVMYGHSDTTSTSTRAVVFYTTNWGSSWARSDSARVGIFAKKGANAFGINYAGFHAFGDSAFAFEGGDSGATSPLVTFPQVRMFTSTFTRGVLDTITTVSGKSGGGSDGLTIVNSDILYFHNFETGANDSIRAYQVQGTLVAGSTWGQLDSVVRAGSPVWAAGQRIPFTWSGDVGGGILCWSPSADDLYWVDTACGFDTLSSAFLGLTTSIYSSWIIQTSNKSGIVIWESATGGPTAVLYARPFTIASVNWGTSSNRTVSFTAAATTLATGLTLRLNAYANPVASVLKGSGADDTVFAIWKDEPDTSGTNWLNRRFSYSVSGDLGATWGARTTLYTFPATDTVVNAQAPYNIYRSGNDIRLAVGWCDSVSAASAEGVNIYLEAITTTPPSTASSNVVVRSVPIRSTAVR